MRFLRYALPMLLAAALVGGPVHAADAPKPAAAALEPIPPNKDNDLRLFYADGRIVKGSASLAKMDSDANLTLWLAGNQFFAMEDVIRACLKQNPKAGNAGLITLPPTA